MGSGGCLGVEHPECSSCSSRHTTGEVPLRGLHAGYAHTLHIARHLIQQAIVHVL
jgi:hypothetical protein